ncbi:hypothetical protein DFA_08853 [Cavenderia fasciculata]|uniref:PX domain-containing protein n=1 Tax=Cavenderia fasciculata TaxID=261658 RepID=F4Q4Q6_CACFS|nr:uncharacterized protein DFA_08853 [Cavenderia fasciculata]EGG17852.1 hypothetical protein DFA_08853 [Cavenderia fasciculata]|eukprot:XP_004356336.1 hypothetical protein DFA_08853 [Cavenderia fasciculata]
MLQQQQHHQHSHNKSSSCTTIMDTEKLVYIGVLLFEIPTTSKTTTTTTITTTPTLTTSTNRLKNSTGIQIEEIFKSERSFVEKKIFQNGPLLYYSSVDNTTTTNQLEGYMSILGCIVDQLHPVEPLCFKLSLLSDSFLDSSTISTSSTTPPNINDSTTNPSSSFDGDHVNNNNSNNNNNNVNNMYISKIFKANDPQDWQMWLNLFGMYSNSKIPKQAISLPLLKLPAGFSQDSPNPVHHRNFNQSAPAQAGIPTPTITPRPPRDWDEDASFLIERFSHLEVDVVLDCIEFCQGDRDEVIALLSSGMRLSYQEDLNGFSPMSDKFLSHKPRTSTNSNRFSSSSSNSAGSTDDSNNNHNNNNNNNVITSTSASTRSAMTGSSGLASPSRKLKRTISRSVNLADYNTSDDEEYNDNSEDDQDDDDDSEDEDDSEEKYYHGHEYGSNEVVHRHLNDEETISEIVEVVQYKSNENLASQLTMSTDSSNTRTGTSPTEDNHPTTTSSLSSSLASSGDDAASSSSNSASSSLYSSGFNYVGHPSTTTNSSVPTTTSTSVSISTTTKRPIKSISYSSSSSYDEEISIVESLLQQNVEISRPNSVIDKEFILLTTPSPPRINQQQYQQQISKQIQEHHQNQLNYQKQQQQQQQQLISTTTTTNIATTTVQPDQPQQQQQISREHNNNNNQNNNNQNVELKIKTSSGQMQPPPQQQWAHRLSIINPNTKSIINPNPLWKSSAKSGASWDLKVQIVGHLKSGEHVEYQLDVSTNYSQWTLYRRYTNFFLLDQKLQSLKIITKAQHRDNRLPPKKLLSSDEIIKSREVELCKYLQQLLKDHPGIFYNNPLVNVFFNGEITSDIFTLFVKQK